MGEESWPENVVRSRGRVDTNQLYFSDKKYPHERYPVHPSGLGEILADGPRWLVCADCGKEQRGRVIHLKPAVYAVVYQGETFYLERHLCVACARKRGLV